MKKLVVCVLLAMCSLTSAQSGNSELLSQLSNAHGVSGFEKPVRDIMRQQWSALGAKLEVDGVGNLIAKLPNFDPKKPTILLMAHMDEVGFLTAEIDKKGYIRAVPLGGWMDHVLWNEHWQIDVNGQSIEVVSGIDPPHVLADFGQTPKLKREKLFFDSGLSKKDLLARGIKPGLPIVPMAKFRHLNQEKNRVVGKAFDDRAGLAIMVEVAKALHERQNKTGDANVVFVATVQEELGMRGSKVVTAAIQPDVILNLDSSIAGDYPYQFAKHKGTELGKGPSVFFYDGSMMPSPGLVALVQDVAKQHRIPLQPEYVHSYGQDGASVQLSGHGAAAVNIGIPLRYAHSHYGIMDMRDYENTTRLLLAVIQDLTPEKIGKLS